MEMSISALLHVSVCASILILGMAQTAQAQAYDEMIKDCKQISDCYKRFSDEVYWIFDQPANGSLDQALEVYLGVYGKVQTINDVSLKQAEKLIADFKKKYGKYGDSPSLLSKRYTEIIEKEKPGERVGDFQPDADNYNELKTAIENYKQKTLDLSATVSQSASYVIDMIEYRDDPNEVANMIKTMVTALNLAKQIDPKNKQAVDLLAKAEVIKTEKIKAIEEARKSARLPKNHPEFKGNATEVVKKALEFINGKKTNPKFNYFTGSIAHPWVERVDVFGNTIDYTIRLFICYQTQGEAANLVHVYQAVLYTCGKKPEASFCTSGVVLGWEYPMLKENIGK